MGSEVAEMEEPTSVLAWGQARQCPESCALPSLGLNSPSDEVSPPSSREKHSPPSLDITAPSPLAALPSWERLAGSKRGSSISWRFGSFPGTVSS